MFMCARSDEEARAKAEGATFFQFCLRYYNSADRKRPAPGQVGHEDRGPAHRRQPADRLADAVIELRRGGVGLQVGQQLDEHLQRLDAGEQRGRAVHPTSSYSRRSL